MQVFQHPSRPWPYTGLILGLAASVSLGLSACASAPMPVEQLAVADAALLRADNPATREQAGIELRMASTKLAAAHNAAKAGDADRARRLATEATVDAEAAEVHAQSLRAERAARDSEEAARVLREELKRKPPG